MFKFAKQREALWPVDLVAADRAMDADGNLVTHRVFIRYRLMTRDELAEANEATTRITAERLREARGNDASANLVELMAVSREVEQRTYDDLLARITGWREGDIADEEGNPLAFDRGIVASLCEDTANYQALLRGLYAASRGAQAKN